MNDEKAASRKHAILLMIANRYDGSFNEYLTFSDLSEVELYKATSFFRSCGFHLPSFSTYRDARDAVVSLIKKIKEYFADELEVLEQ